MDEVRLLERLKTAGAIENTDGWTLQPAGGGLNTEVFFIEQSGEGIALTVRLARSGIDLRREAGYLAQLSDCPGIPRILHVERDLLAHERLPGAPAPLADATDDELDSLTRVLVCIHAHDVDHYVVWPDLTEQHGTRAELLRARIASLPDYRSFESLPCDDLESLYQALCETELDGPGWDAEQFALIHGDLSIGNILWSETGVALIDWEYTRPSDPAEELAYLITEQLVPDDTVQHLRNTYIAHGGARDAWERVPAWLPFTSLDSAFWWCDHLLERGEDPANHPEVRARIATAQGWL